MVKLIGGGSVINGAYPSSSYEPHETYVSGFTFLLHQEGPKKPQSILSLLSRGWNSLPGACSDRDLGIFFLVEDSGSSETSQGNRICLEGYNTIVVLGITLLLDK